MYRNYIMLPENIQRRPCPGHRHCIKKVSKTISLMSRVGRRAPGEAKETATMAGNAKKQEEVRAEEFAKLVKTLNSREATQRHAAPPAGEAVEVDSAPRPMKTSNRIAAWLATPDGTQGPRAYSVPQDVQPTIGQPGFVVDPLAQQPEFDPTVMFQVPIYETLRPPGYQQIIDQDYRLWPPVDANADNRFSPPLPPQEPIINQGFPLHPFIPADHNLFVKQHPPLMPHFYHNTQEFVVNQYPAQQTLDGWIFERL